MGGLLGQQRHPAPVHGLHLPHPAYQLGGHYLRAEAGQDPLSPSRVVGLAAFPLRLVLSQAAVLQRAAVRHFLLRPPPGNQLLLLQATFCPFWSTDPAAELMPTGFCPLSAQRAAPVLPPVVMQRAAPFFCCIVIHTVTCVPPRLCYAVLK